MEQTQYMESAHTRHAQSTHTLHVYTTHKNTHATHTYTHIPSVAPDDYDALTNFPLGPFNNDARQLSFNVSIVNDNIPEDTEMFNVSLTLDPADQATLGNVTFSPDVVTITILDNDGIY